MSSNTSPINEPQDRRTFLKRTLLGGALLFAGSGTLLALRKGNTEPVAPAPLASFDPAVFPVLLAVIARVVPFPDADAVKIALSMDLSLSYTPPAVRGDVNKILALLENSLAGLLTRSSITPFTQLSPEAQDRALAAWRDSRLAPLTAAYNALRKIALSAYYKNPDIAHSIGYPGPLFEKADPGPLQPRGPISKPFVVTPLPVAETSK